VRFTDASWHRWTGPSRNWEKRVFLGNRFRNFQTDSRELIVCLKQKMQEPNPEAIFFTFERAVPDVVKLFSVRNLNVGISTKIFKPWEAFENLQYTRKSRLIAYSLLKEYPNFFNGYIHSNLVILDCIYYCFWCIIIF